jgi:hypothetical protein
VPVVAAEGVDGLEGAVQRAERALLCETLQRISLGELVLYSFSTGMPETGK